MNRLILSLILVATLAAGAAAQSAAAVPGTLAQDLRDYVATPAVEGYETALADHIAQELQAYAPRRDNLGDVIVTLPGPAGSTAAPHLFAAGLDEPGYVVSALTPDGYLRLERLPTRGRLPLFQQLWTAQPVEVETSRGQWLHGVVTGLSVHLQSGRVQRPNGADPANLYVDIGAASRAEALAAGVQVLSPVALDRSLQVLGDGQLSGYALDDRYGAAVLVEALRHLDPEKLTGPVTLAWVAQQGSGARGLQRVRQMLGAGVATTLVGAAAPRGETGVDSWTVPVRWAATPIAAISAGDLTQLAAKVETALGQAPQTVALPQPAALPPPPLPARPPATPTPEAILQPLVAQYGVHPHEQRVSAAIQALLPGWAQPLTDDAGNVVLHWADAGSNAPRLLFVAHQDETGFAVEAIAPDGRLRLRTRGGVYLPYYLGHPVLVHTAAGDMRPGLLELPAGWDQPGFNFAAPEIARAPLWADVGARSAAEVASLGIAVGDSITVPKQYRKLLGSRATARSFDDRVGSAALIAAAWKLGPSLPGRDITFAWTTGEEIGLLGAQAMAARLAAAGRAPDYVFAIDTFVSSDTPLEEHYMADTPIGEGFVIRAIDDSSITPWPLAQRLRALAEQAHIPVQTGETSGGNDGSAFLRYGAVDLPLGWPLRTSHSPAEVIDTRDLDSLARMIESLTHNW